MSEHGAEFDRRAAQFREYLKLMYKRSHEIAEGFCFMVFEENRRNDGCGRTRKAAKDRERVLATTAGTPGETGVLTPDERSALDALDAEMDEEFPFNRYIQFGFEEDRFLMDLPLGTLFKDEAEEIIPSPVE